MNAAPIPDCCSGPFPIGAEPIGMAIPFLGVLLVMANKLIAMAVFFSHVALCVYAGVRILSEDDNFQYPWVRDWFDETPGEN